MKARLEMAMPDQIIEEVVRHIVDITDIVRFSLVSKFWYSYLHSKFYWERRSVITCSITGIFGGYFRGYGYGYSRFGLGVSTLPSLHYWALEKWPHSDHISPFLSVSQSHDHLCSGDWKEWPHSDQISPRFRVSHSHGLCCSLDQNGVYVYDPFTYCTRKLICPYPNFEWSSILDVCLHLELSTDNYLVLLFVQLSAPFQPTEPYLVIYEASTDSWRKSQSLQGCARYLDGRCRPICVGDSIGSLSVYFSDQEKIYKYSFATDSWSEKPFAMASLSQSKVQHLILIQSDGKLMFVGKQSDELCIWLASEDDKSYVCAMLASIAITIKEGWVVADADCGQDLICIHCQIDTQEIAWFDITEDHESHESDLIIVYIPSTNRWQFLDCPTLGNELRPFYADVRQLFVLEPRLDVRRLLLTN